MAKQCSRQLRCSFHSQQKIKVFVFAHYKKFCSSFVVGLFTNLNFITMEKIKKILAAVVKYGGWVVAAATYLLNALGAI